MTPKAPKETPEQRQQRLRAEADNLNALQETLQNRTARFRRLQSPRVSIVTGKRAPLAQPLVS